MTNALTDTDKMIAAAEKFGDKLAQLAAQYGPDVADMALGVARVDALSAIATAAVPAVFAIVGAVFVAVHGAKLGAKWTDHSVKEAAYWAPEGGGRERAAASRALGSALLSTALTVAGAVALVAGGVNALTRLTNVWAWVGIFEPKVWLAGKLLGWM